MPITQKKQGFSFFRAAIGIVVVIGVYQVVEAILFPWARSLTGAPTLTGEWMGEMTTVSGRHFLIWMELGHSTGSPGVRQTFSLEGAAQTCEATGEQRRYRVLGNVANRRGTAFNISMYANPAQAHTLTIGGFDGQWLGNKLEISGTNLFMPNPGKKDPDTDDEPRWHMQPGTKKDFQMKCSSI